MKQIEVSREFLEEFEELRKDFNMYSVYMVTGEIYRRGSSDIIAEHLFSDDLDTNNSNQLEFAEVWAGKAEYVAKEQLYYVRLRNLGYMTRSIGYPLTSSVDSAAKFTEQEIKAIDERYMAFAIPVEELGGKK